MQLQHALLQPTPQDFLMLEAARGRPKFVYLVRPAILMRLFARF
jgi:hypothetical protein